MVSPSELQTWSPREQVMSRLGCLGNTWVPCPMQLHHRSGPGLSFGRPSSQAAPRATQTQGCTYPSDSRDVETVGEGRALNGAGCRAWAKGARAKGPGVVHLHGGRGAPEVTCARSEAGQGAHALRGGAGCRLSSPGRPPMAPFNLRVRSRGPSPSFPGAAPASSRILRGTRRGGSGTPGGTRTISTRRKGRAGVPRTSWWPGRAHRARTPLVGPSGLPARARGPFKDLLRPPASLPRA